MAYVTVSDGNQIFAVDTANASGAVTMTPDAATMQKAVAALTAALDTATKIHAALAAIAPAAPAESGGTTTGGTTTGGTTTGS